MYICHRPHVLEDNLALGSHSLYIFYATPFSNCEWVVPVFSSVEFCKILYYIFRGEFLPFRESNRK